MATKKEDKDNKPYALNSRSDKHRNLPAAVAPERTEAQKDYWGQGQSLLAPRGTAQVPEAPQKPGGDYVKDIASLMDKMGDDVPAADKISMAKSVIQERETAQAQQPIDNIYKGEMTRSIRGDLGPTRPETIPYYFNTGAAGQAGLSPGDFAKKKGIQNLSPLGGGPVEPPPDTTTVEEKPGLKNITDYPKSIQKMYPREATQNEKDIRKGPSISMLDWKTEQNIASKEYEAQQEIEKNQQDGPIFKAPDAWTAPSGSGNQPAGRWTQGQGRFNPIKSFKEMWDELFNDKVLRDRTKMGGIM